MKKIYQKLKKFYTADTGHLVIGIFALFVTIAITTKAVCLQYPANLIITSATWGMYLVYNFRNYFMVKHFEEKEDAEKNKDTNSKDA